VQELKYATSDFCVLTVRDFLHANARSLFNMVCIWLGLLDMRQRSSANRMWVTKTFLFHNVNVEDDTGQCCMMAMALPPGRGEETKGTACLAKTTRKKNDGYD